MTAHGTSSSEGTVTVTDTGSGTFTQQITAGHHRLVADEPRPIGGGVTACRRYLV
jgi:putative redox protein